jgi:hypothetical protein
MDDNASATAIQEDPVRGMSEHLAMAAREVGGNGP